MALNTLKCNHLMPLPFKGLSYREEFVASYSNFCMGLYYLSHVHAFEIIMFNANSYYLRPPPAHSRRRT